MFIVAFVQLARPKRTYIKLVKSLLQQLRLKRNRRKKKKTRIKENENECER